MTDLSLLPITYPEPLIRLTKTVLISRVVRECPLTPRDPACSTDTELGQVLDKIAQCLRRMQLALAEELRNVTGKGSSMKGVPH